MWLMILNDVDDDIAANDDDSDDDGDDDDGAWAHATSQKYITPETNIVNKCKLQTCYAPEELHIHRVGFLFLL